LKREVEFLTEEVHKSGVIFVGNEIVLAVGGKRYTENATPALMLNLKLVCHVAFGTYINLAQAAVSGKVDDDTLRVLKEYQALIAPANVSIVNRNFTQAQIERAYVILNASNTILLQAIHTKTISFSQLVEFARPIKPLLSENIAEAAIAQLNMVHGFMTTWKETVFTSEQWERFWVVVETSHMARHGELFLQYFNALLGTRFGSGERVIAAENTNAEQSFKLVGTHLVDFSVGKVFFNDAEHMHSDILAPATAAYLPELLGYSTADEERMTSEARRLAQLLLNKSVEQL